MTEFNANDFEGALEFFILSGFKDGPLSVSEIQQRIEWAERLLYLAAKRNGKSSPGSLSEVLWKLRSEGSLKIERAGEKVGADIIYSLTDVGARRLEQERMHRMSIVSQWVENSELDTSFRKFLDRKDPLWPS